MPHPQQMPHAQQAPQVVYVERKKKGGCLKAGALIVGFLLFLFVLIAILSDGDSASDGAVPAANSQGKDGEPRDPNEPLEVGESFTTKKSLDIKVSSFDSATSYFGDPVSCAEVTYTNNGTEVTDFAGYWDWKAQNPAGVITDPEFLSNMHTLESGELAPGGMVSGNVCFEGAEPGEYRLNYEPTLSFSSDKASWKATL
ncbi:DUF4352 domain-containing protein [Corynebacterium sp. H113]|uniref:DUF4352 domain-containing protein n=1 Tax=Corynebacterium sp. H113 TaxID=3133419 RepID=UPI0030B0B2B6